MKFFNLKSKKYKKYLKIFWSIYIAGVLSVVILFTLLSFGMLGFMPDFKELENPNILLATELISSDGETFGKFLRENRTLEEFDNISKEVIKALIATEDYRFQKHSGIDMQSLARVAGKTVLLNKGHSGGGSTITQQLAKLLFPREEFSNKLQIVLRKFKEWIIAVKLEKSYTKKEIITMYLNKFDFLNLAVGIKSAAKTYFNKTPKELTTNESAMLVGMVQNPAIYNPRRRPEKTKRRRNVVLSQMHKYNYLSKEAFDSLKTKDLNLNINVTSHKRGIATYFREFIRTYITRKQPKRSNYASFQQALYEKNLKLWETDPLYGWCNKNLTPEGRPYDLYEDGLKIYTTIDSRIQRAAENAVTSHLKKNLQPSFKNEFKAMRHPPFSNDLDEKTIDRILKNSIKRTPKYWEMVRRDKLPMDSVLKYFNTPHKTTVFTWNGAKDTVMTPLDELIHHKKFLRSSLYSVDPKNGHVKAYVGGQDLAYFNYDMVTLGKRQVGSTIKPFLYTVAIQNGISPCKKVPNVKYTFLVNDTVWAPRNASKLEDTKTLESLNWGLAHSVNTMSAWLMKNYKPELVAKLMHEMGVASDIMAVPSIFLGTSEMTIQELTNAFATYANKGVYNKPLYVTKITDKFGNLLAEFKPESKQVLGEHESRTMIDMLIDVVEQGTGKRLGTTYYEYGNLREAQIGGKTGTTQSHADGIFVGLTPNLVTGVWTGGEERSIHFDDLRQGQGANMALPIFGYLMNEVYADSTIGITKQDSFFIPNGYRKYGCSAAMSLEGQRVNQKSVEEVKKQLDAVDNEEEEDFF
jgi:penicillin-binding protein 1A